MLVDAFASSQATSRTSLASAILSWWQARRQRRALVEDLARLSSEQLRDIGMERHDIAGMVDFELTRMDLRRLGSGEITT